MGPKDEAEKQYLLSLETYPESVSTHLNYGNLLKDTERYDEAERQYQLVIELDPKNPDRYDDYGLLLLLMNLEEKAIEKAKIASRLFEEKGDRRGHPKNNFILK